MNVCHYLSGLLHDKEISMVMVVSSDLRSLYFTEYCQFKQEKGESSCIHWEPGFLVLFVKCSLIQLNQLRIKVCCCCFVLFFRQSWYCYWCWQCYYYWATQAFFSNIVTTCFTVIWKSDQQHTEHWAEDEGGGYRTERIGCLMKKHLGKINWNHFQPIKSFSHYIIIIITTIIIIILSITTTIIVMTIIITTTTPNTTSIIWSIIIILYYPFHFILSMFPFQYPEHWRPPAPLPRTSLCSLVCVLHFSSSQSGITSALPQRLCRLFLLVSAPITVPRVTAVRAWLDRLSRCTISTLVTWAAVQKMKVHQLGSHVYCTLHVHSNNIERVHARKLYMPILLWFFMSLRIHWNLPCWLVLHEKSPCVSSSRQKKKGEMTWESTPPTPPLYKSLGTRLTLINFSLIIFFHFSFAWQRIWGRF